MEGISEVDLDEQMAHVAAALDPIFDNDPAPASQDPALAPMVRVLPPPTAT